MNTRSPFRKFITHICATTAVFTFADGSAHADVVAADLNTTSDGTIGGSSFTITGLSSNFLAVESNKSFTGSSYAPAPQSNVEDVVYGASNDWTVSFSTALSDL